MNQAVPVWGVVLAAVGLFIGFVLHRWVTSLVNSAQRMIDGHTELCRRLEALDNSLDCLREACNHLAKQLSDESLRSQFALVPKLLETVVRVGNAQLEIAQAQRRQQQNPFGQSNRMPPRDVEAANQEDRIQEMMRGEGITREEALLRLNPANMGSLWEGSQAQPWFDGWSNR
ncbi:MAG: hypothetical protein ACM34G_17285 [Acidobacteriota bacterium]